MRPMLAGALTVCGLLLILLTSGSAQPDERARLIESVQGPALYNAYCAVCHGTDGKGAGPLAKSLKLATPDLTRIAVRSNGKFPLERLQKIISGEQAVAAGHGTREMPVWGPIFSQVAWDQDLGRLRVYNLAKHIEQMQKK